MTDHESARRRSPQWVRDTDLRTLHGIAFRLMEVSRTVDLTEGQEWLWAALVSELEYRFRHPGPGERRCACMMCVPPFPDADLEV